MTRPYDLTRNPSRPRGIPQRATGRPGMRDVPMCPCCYQAHPPTALGVIVAHRDADGYRCEGMGRETVMGCAPRTRLRVDGGEHE